MALGINYYLSPIYADLVTGIITDQNAVTFISSYTADSIDNSIRREDCLS